MELTDAEVTEFYQPKDLKVGNTVFVLGRRFLLYDCDQFTRNYFEKVLHIKQGPPIKVFDEPKPFAPKVIYCLKLKLQRNHNYDSMCFQLVYNTTKPFSSSSCIPMYMNFNISRYLMHLLPSKLLLN